MRRVVLEAAALPAFFAAFAAVEGVWLVCVAWSVGVGIAVARALLLSVGSTTTGPVTPDESNERKETR